MGRPVHVKAADGTELFVDDRGPIDSAATPVLCLPGLTRNSRDFEPVFRLLDAERRIIAVDLRGRGRSGRADVRSYVPAVELQDVLRILDHLKVDRVALIGTSRGGLVGMLMANLAKHRLAGLLLNDIGPRLEPAGLARIADHVGRSVRHASWDDAAAALAASAVGFSGVPHSGWMSAARRLYAEDGGFIVHTHDLALAQSLPTAETIAAGLVPELWQMVPALAGLPLAVLRGAGSDLLSDTTCMRLKRALPDTAYTIVPQRGHVPFLDETESADAIRRWLARVDESEKGASKTGPSFNP